MALKQRCEGNHHVFSEELDWISYQLKYDVHLSTNFPVQRYLTGLDQQETWVRWFKHDFSTRTVPLYETKKLSFTPNQFK